MPIPKSILCLTYLLLQNLGNFVASSPLPGETSDVDNDNCVTTEEECIHYASTAGPGVSWSGVVSSFDLPSGCIRIWIENSDDQVWLNTNEFGAGSVDGVSPVCQYSTELSAGGDPHFLGFFEHFSFMGECDLILLSTPPTTGADQKNNLQVHVRTTIKQDFSYISGIAAKIGSHILEVKENGSLWMNSDMVFSTKMTPEEQDETTRKVNDGLHFSVTQRYKGKQRKIVVYEIVLQNGVELVIRANLKNHMLFIGTGNGSIFPDGTMGLLGSPKKPGFVTRDGVEIKTGQDMNAYSESWQVRPDIDTKLFMDSDRAPQFPSKCLYPESETVQASLRRRKLMDDNNNAVPKISLEAATEACKDMSEVKRNFCIEDTMHTGDLTLALDEFYH
jgi:hypothetical protein